MTLDAGLLRISQEAYIDGMLREYDLAETPGKDTPAPQDEITEADLPKTNGEREKVKRYPVRNAIGKLWWLALISRPDIICALHKCAVCMAE